jgi:hypothetical protein
LRLCGGLLRLLVRARLLHPRRLLPRLRRPPLLRRPLKAPRPQLSRHVRLAAKAELHLVPAAVSASRLLRCWSMARW